MGLRSKFSQNLIASSAFIFLLLTVASQPAFAAGKSAPNITIAPFLQTVQIKPSDAIESFPVSLTNNSNQAKSLHLSVLNFGSLDETGGVVFAGSNASNLVKKYGLATWMQLSADEVSLDPGQSATIVATITNEPSQSPGGHYGAIIASLNPPDEEKSRQVDIRQQLSALVLATKIGGEKYDLRLSSIATHGNLGRLPSTVNVRFFNPGNVHVVPRGVVKLLAPNGRVVSQGAINEASDFVLPETYRQIPVSLHLVQGVGWLPGVYHLRIDYRYDGYDQYASKSFTLQYVNLPGIIIVIILLAALAWVVVKFRQRLTDGANVLYTRLREVWQGSVKRHKVITKRGKQDAKNPQLKLIEDIKHPPKRKG